MAETKTGPEPRGFGEHTRRTSGENAHQQGWGLNEDERRRLPNTRKDYQGGTDDEYGARDFGDEAVDTRAATPSAAVRKEIRSEAREEKFRKAG